MLSKLSFWHTFKVYCAHKYSKHLKKEREPVFLCTHWLLVVLLLIQALNGLFSCISADTVWMEQFTHSQSLFILSPSSVFSSFCLPLPSCIPSEIGLVSLGETVCRTFCVALNMLMGHLCFKAKGICRRGLLWPAECVYHQTWFAVLSPGLENLIPDDFMLTQIYRTFLPAVSKGGSASPVRSGLDSYSSMFCARFSSNHGCRDT